MFRLVGFATVATAIYVSCYQPSFRDCEISCTAQSGCPSGLSCDTGAGRCALHGICAPNDAQVGDGDGGSIDVSTECWGYAPTNYAPCETGFPIATGNLGVETTTIDTNGSACSYQNGDVCLYHYLNISISAGLTVTGKRPLILVADNEIDVMSTISFDGAIQDPGSSCNAPIVPMASLKGAGGGGGGYGSSGGAGGSGAGVQAPLGGDSFGSASLAPLMLGCPGATGGSGGMTEPGAGGFGGGAIELSSKSNVVIVSGGVVSADGGGGAGGVGFAMTVAGGGGGGAGGSVLIEGHSVTVAGKLCAVGGAGAQGGSATIGIDGGAGMSCTPGANGVTGPGAGGNGGGSTAATSGTASSTTIGGGGGGGSIGRIRIHSISMSDTTGSMSVPPFVPQ